MWNVRRKYSQVLINLYLGLRFLVKICSDLGIAELKDYQAKLSKVETGAEMIDFFGNDNKKIFDEPIVVPNFQNIKIATKQGKNTLCCF